MKESMKKGTYKKGGDLCGVKSRRLLGAGVGEMFRLGTTRMRCSRIVLVTTRDLLWEEDLIITLDEKNKIFVGFGQIQHDQADTGGDGSALAHVQEALTATTYDNGASRIPDH